MEFPPSNLNKSISRWSGKRGSIGGIRIKWTEDFGAGGGGEHWNISRNGHHRWDKKGVIWTCFSLESESMCFHDLIPTCSFPLILQVICRSLYMWNLLLQGKPIFQVTIDPFCQIYIYIYIYILYTGNWKMRVPIYIYIEVCRFIFVNLVDVKGLPL